MFKIYVPMMLLLVSAQYYALLIWSNDSNNERPYVTINESLMHAAQWKAEYLANGHSFAHCTEDDECPNQTITRFGCKHEYSVNGNSVESLIKGLDDPSKAYEILLTSKDHRRHLLATIDFFKEQTDIGVGHSQNVFVFISAKCIK